MDLLIPPIVFIDLPQLSYPFPKLSVSTSFNLLLLLIELSLSLPSFEVTDIPLALDFDALALLVTSP
jgi:hypothetical protein